MRLRTASSGQASCNVYLLLRLAVSCYCCCCSLVRGFSILAPFRTDNIFGLGGGRPANTPNKIVGEDGSDTNSQPWQVTPCAPNESRLVVVAVTDVYTLENFAHLKTLVEETRAKSNGAKVVCMLTGDFLSPYLLSSIDKGAGMMNALCSVPMDYLTWGNHEADIEHKVVCKYVRQFAKAGGKWINSNMLDHEVMEHQHEYDVIEIESPDKSQKRKVGLCAVLSDDPALYSHFEAPGAFGGATITDPWETLKKFNHILKNEEGCDVVLPLQHLYVPDDHKTCREFDFPAILSGHDHHRVDEVVEGTRLLKAGMNAEYATVLEYSWPDGSAEKPIVCSRFVRCQDWAADPMLKEQCEKAYDCLLPLRNTELARVPPNFEPLTSNGSRECVCTMGKYICSLLKSALNVSKNLRKGQIDAVVLMGGNIRGNADYALGSFFSLEALEAEIKSDEVVGTVPMPGWLLAKGIEETHSGDPIPGWMQYDEGVEEDTSGPTPKVTKVAGEPLDPNRIYRVATKISDLTNGQSPSWTEYFSENKHLLPPKGTYFNINSELMAYFSRNLWRKLWEAISREVVEERCPLDDIECNAAEQLNALDLNGSGYVTVREIQIALEKYLGYSVDKREQTFAKFVHSFADQTGDGRVTKKDFEILLDEIVPISEGPEFSRQGPSCIEVRGSDEDVVTVVDGTQRNFMRNRTEPPVEADKSLFPDFSRILTSAILGETNVPVDRSDTLSS